jgi:hypothetical protein
MSQIIGDVVTLGSAGGGKQTIPDDYCLAYIEPKVSSTKSYYYTLNNKAKITRESEDLPYYYLVPTVSYKGFISIQSASDYVMEMPAKVTNATLVSGGLNQYQLKYSIIDGTKPVEITGFAFACLIAGTLITLADGTKKPIEEITYDDNLLVWDFYNGCFASAKPSWIKIRQTAEVYNKLTFDNGTTLGLVGDGGTRGYHRIFNKQACCFTHTGVPETPIGTITFAEDKSEPMLVRQELVNETVDYYNIITDKHFNIFANGILTSCRCSNLYKIENMKYAGERTMSDKEVEEYFKRLKNLQLAR